MTRIIVEPEALQVTGQQLQGSARDLQALGDRLIQAYRSINWEAQIEAGVERDIEMSQAAAAAIADQLQALSSYLHRKSQQFSDSDVAGAQLVEGVGAAAGIAAMVPPSWRPSALLSAVPWTVFAGLGIAPWAGWLMPGTLPVIPWIVGKFPDLFGKKPSNDGVSGIANQPPDGAAAGSGTGQAPPAAQSAGNPRERYDSSNNCYAKEHPNFDELATGALNRGESEQLLKSRFPKYWRAMGPTLDAEGRDWFRSVAGDFDGQGASVGCLQWNFGQKTLQPLLQKMHDEHPELWNKIFPNGHGEQLSAHMNDLGWIQEHLNNGNKMNHEWARDFDMLCTTKEFQEIQLQGMQDGYWQRSMDRASFWGFHSERGVAAVFNATVQSGGFMENARAISVWESSTGVHRGEYGSFDSFLDACAERVRDRSDVEKIAMFRDVYAAQANPRWSSNVRDRFDRILSDGELSDTALN